jgi:S-adenosylmethionine:diacylglycerol 3-amino-3-carboxypropyl transferase
VPAAGTEGVSQDQIRKRQDQALMFEKYIDESGLSLSFQIIFTEIIQKQIPEDQVFAYTAMRLRQIGKELEKIDSKAPNAAPK